MRWMRNSKAALPGAGGHLANDDIDEEQNADTSANYLGVEVLKRAGVAHGCLANFLLTLKESYPVISAVVPWKRM